MEERSYIPLLDKVAGFSLRAATKRLSVDGRGRVVYQYKQPFRDGRR